MADLGHIDICITDISLYGDLGCHYFGSALNISSYFSYGHSRIADPFAHFRTLNVKLGMRFQNGSK